MTKQYDIYFGLDKPYSVDGVIMAFDFGTKKIGVAVGQAITKTATPLKPILVKEGAHYWQALEALINTWRPKALIVGVPVHKETLKEPITKKAIQFAKQLKQRSKLPVFGVDETLTSFSARQALYEIGGSRLIKKHSIDSIAATLILESWLTMTISG